MAGEFNTNGRLISAQHVDETAALIHNLAKRNDSGQSCSRAEEFQPWCKDKHCPDCNADYLNVDQLYEDALLGTVAHNVIGQVASEDDQNILSCHFGHVEFDKIDKTGLNPSKGNL